MATRRRPTLLHARFGGRRWGVLVRGVPRLPYETGPGLREGLQPRVERGRAWPARPTRRTRIALGRSTAIARSLMCLYSPRRCSCAPRVTRVQAARRFVSGPFFCTTNHDGLGSCTETPILRFSVMLIGSMRVSSSGDRQAVDLQLDAVLAGGVNERHLHTGDRGTDTARTRGVAAL